MQFTRNVKIGFEIEAYMAGDDYLSFTYDVKNIDKKILFGDDGSIQLNDEDNLKQDEEGTSFDVFEIKTFPLPVAKSLSVLSKIFKLMIKYGVKTNDSTGLHVNISHDNKSRQKDFNPVTFLNTDLWARLLKKYKREDNEYCLIHHLKDDSLYEIFRQAGEYDEHHSAVSFRNYPTRIEIRTFGNKNYHKKFKTIKKDVAEILKQFNQSSLKIKRAA